MADENAAPEKTNNPQDAEMKDKALDIHPDKDNPDILKHDPACEMNEIKLPPREIFVVLSERDDFNQECLDALQNYGIQPIILNTPNEIRSIAEILNQFRQVQFALILLAGDDFIYDRAKGKPGEAHLGAKSNTVFHLGYLLAKFGNMGTLSLYREQKSFRLPTGLQHTAFVPYEKNGKWKQILESKLKTIKIL
jgi:predicted nucleotide-binding protein